MTTIDAWRKVFSLGIGTWEKIPAELSGILELPADLGIYGGTLCSRRSAIAIDAFTSRVNARLAAIAAEMGL